MQVNQGAFRNHACHCFPVTFKHSLAYFGSTDNFAIDFFSRDDVQFDTVFRQNFAHSLVVSHSSFIVGFFTNVTSSDVQFRSNALCKNHCVQTSLCCQLVSTLDEVSGESCVGNNVVTTADYNNVAQISNALFHQGKAVRKGNCRTVFLYCENNYFVTVTSSFFNYSTVPQSKGVAVHNDCRTFFTIACAQDATYAFQIFI